MIDYHLFERLYHWIVAFLLVQIGLQIIKKTFNASSATKKTDDVRSNCEFNNDAMSIKISYIVEVAQACVSAGNVVMSCLQLKFIQF